MRSCAQECVALLHWNRHIPNVFRTCWGAAVVCINRCLNGTVPADYPDYPRLPLITPAPDYVITLFWQPCCAVMCARMCRTFVLESLYSYVFCTFWGAAVICINWCLNGTVPADYPDYARLPLITPAPDYPSLAPRLCCNFTI